MLVVVICGVVVAATTLLGHAPIARDQHLLTRLSLVPSLLLRWDALFAVIASTEEWVLQLLRAPCDARHGSFTEG